MDTTIPPEFRLNGWSGMTPLERLSARDVPDALLPTDNVWGVPVLDPTMQADAVDLPVNAWGSMGRRRTEKLAGSTIHCYVDDNRFEGLWNDPTGIVNVCPINVVEPNFSTNPQMPAALVLWHIYRKRWLARWWQSLGIRIFVDLDVHPQWTELNLLGVPRGWRSYACYMRQSDHKPEELDIFLSIAQHHAGTESILLLVVGGGAEVQAMCRERYQCAWVESFDQAFYRNYRQKTQGG